MINEEGLGGDGGEGVVRVGGEVGMDRVLRGEER